MIWGYHNFRKHPYFLFPMSQMHKTSTHRCSFFFRGKEWKFPSWLGVNTQRTTTTGPNVFFHPPGNIRFQKKTFFFLNQGKTRGVFSLPPRLTSHESEIYSPQKLNIIKNGPYDRCTWSEITPIKG